MLIQCLPTENCKKVTQASQIKNKTIEEICGKPTWPGSFSRLEALRVTFSKNKKPVFRYGLGQCVYRISGLYVFFCCDKKGPYIHTYLQVKI